MQMTGRWSERKLNQNTKSLREFPTHSAAIRQNRGRMTFVWGFRWLPDEHDGGFLSYFQTRNIFVKKVHRLCISIDSGLSFACLLKNLSMLSFACFEGFFLFRKILTLKIFYV